MVLNVPNHQHLWREANVFCFKIAVIEDFFRLLVDALIYYHDQLVPAAICSPILTSAISALSLQQEPPLIATLHFLRDLLSYGTDSPNYSDLTGTQQQAQMTKIKDTVRQLIVNQGEALVQRVLTGMMFSFPNDCLQDASGVLLTLFELMPHETATWIKSTVALLPPGSVKAGEIDKLMNTIGQKIQAGDVTKIRATLQGKISPTQTRRLLFAKIGQTSPPVIEGEMLHLGKVLDA